MRQKLNQSGDMNLLLMPLVFMTLLFLLAAGFASWAYASRQDYKNNTDQKIATAVEIAKREEGQAKDLAHAETEKNPLTNYKGPEQFGSVDVAYPKTWSAYVNNTTTGNQPLDAYFNPRVVPSAQDPNSVFSMRIKVLPQSYTTVVKALEGPIKAKTLTATPFTYPKVPGVVGLRLDGQIIPGKKTNGSMIIMPLRDKTMQVWTESPEFAADFNNIIIPNLVFSP